MTRSRRSRRIQRADAEYVWCALLVTPNTISGATAEEQIIVDGTDWFGGGGQAECVLQRIRGSFGCYPTVGAEASNGIIQMAIYKAEEDAGAYAVAWAADELVDEDVLFFKQWTMGRSATGIAQVPALDWDIDVKTKRKLKSNEHIRLMVSATFTATYHVATRALVRL